MNKKEKIEMDDLFPEYNTIMEHVDAFYMHPESRSALLAQPALGGALPWCLVRYGSDDHVGIIVDGVLKNGAWDLAQPLCVFAINTTQDLCFVHVLPTCDPVRVLGEYAIASAAERLTVRIEALQKLAALTHLWASSPDRVARWHQLACVHNLPAFPQHIATLDYGEDVFEGLVIGGMITPKGAWSLTHELTLFCATGAVVTLNPLRAYDVTLRPS